MTGKQTKPLPLALLRGRAGPPLPMCSQHKQARTKDFKAATQTPHTGSVSDISGHVTPCQVHSDWVLGRATWSLPLSVLIGSQSGTLPPLRWPFWGLRPPPRLAEHLLLSNMPTRSPRRHNRPLIHTPSSPPSLPVRLPPARWDQTHACCLTNAKTCQRCPVSCEVS